MLIFPHKWLKDVIVKRCKQSGSEWFGERCSVLEEETELFTVVVIGGGDFAAELRRNYKNWVENNFVSERKSVV